MGLSIPKFPADWRIRHGRNHQFNDGLWRAPFRGTLFDVTPFRRTSADLTALPAVDVSETDKAYEITAELPGIDEKNVDVRVANGILTIKGEKQDEKEEKQKCDN